MIGATVVLALATLGAAAPAAASDDWKMEQQNQLETARLPQAAQRVEFGVEGDASAFKFRFSDPVCITPWKSHHISPRRREKWGPHASQFSHLNYPTVRASTCAVQE